MLYVVNGHAVTEQFEGSRVDRHVERAAGPFEPGEMAAGDGLEDALPSCSGVDDLKGGVLRDHSAEDGEQRRGVLVADEDGQVALGDVAVGVGVEHAGPRVSRAGDVGDQAVMPGRRLELVEPSALLELEFGDRATLAQPRLADVPQSSQSDRSPRPPALSGSPRRVSAQ